MYGLGTDAAGPLFQCPTGEMVHSSSDCPGGQPAPDVQEQIAQVWSYLMGMQAPDSSIVKAATPAQTWVPGIPNLVTGVVGASLLLVLLKAGR